jgi:hypothetical protein
MQITGMHYRIGDVPNRWNQAEGRCQDIADEELKSQTLLFHPADSSADENRQGQ